MPLGEPDTRESILIAKLGGFKNKPILVSFQGRFASGEEHDTELDFVFCHLAAGLTDIRSRSKLPFWYHRHVVPAFPTMRDRLAPSNARSKEHRDDRPLQSDVRYQ